MLIIIPIGPTLRVIPVLILMCLLFAAGCILSMTAVWIFTAPALLTKVHLWALPVALLTGVIMYGLARQTFKSGDSGDSGSGFFAMCEQSPAVVLCSPF